MAQISRTGEHLDRRIVIQRAKSNAVYNAYHTDQIQALHQDPTAAICSKRSTMDRFIVTVDRFDQTVMPKYPIKRHVLSICNAFELEINPIDMFRHLPS